MASFSWPSTTGGSSSNASIGPTGSTAPTSATEIAGVNPSGNLTPLQVDSSGNLLVSLAAEPVNPFSVNISAYGGTSTTLGQKVSASSMPIVIASDQSAVPISAVSLPLPTGAATSANQTNASQKTQIVDGSGNVIASTSNALNVQVENFPATQPVSGTVAVTQSTSPWVVGQSTASALNATVVQGTASNLLTQVSQPTASSLNATVVQGTAANLLAQVSQPTAANLNATVVQGTAANLNATVVGTVFSQALQGTLTDDSGTTSGTPSTSTQIMASNASRKYLLIENVSTTATIWINFTSAATAGNGSYQLLPGGSIVQESGFVSTEAVNVLSTTATVPYTAKQA
jgi:hypothetical protein